MGTIRLQYACSQPQEARKLVAKVMIVILVVLSTVWLGEPGKTSLIMLIM